MLVLCSICEQSLQPNPNIMELDAFLLYQALIVLLQIVQRRTEWTGIFLKVLLQGRCSTINNNSYQNLKNSTLVLCTAETVPGNRHQQCQEPKIPPTHTNLRQFQHPWLHKCLDTLKYRQRNHKIKPVIPKCFVTQCNVRQEIFLVLIHLTC